MAENQKFALEIIQDWLAQYDPAGAGRNAKMLINLSDSLDLQNYCDGLLRTSKEEYIESASESIAYGARESRISASEIASEIENLIHEVEEFFPAGEERYLLAGDDRPRTLEEIAEIIYSDHLEELAERILDQFEADGSLHSYRLDQDICEDLEQAVRYAADYAEVFPLAAEPEWELTDDSCYQWVKRTFDGPSEKDIVFDLAEVREVQPGRYVAFADTIRFGDITAEQLRSVESSYGWPEPIDQLDPQVIAEAVFESFSDDPVSDEVHKSIGWACAEIDERVLGESHPNLWASSDSEVEAKLARIADEYLPEINPDMYCYNRIVFGLSERFRDFTDPESAAEGRSFGDLAAAMDLRADILAQIEGLISELHPFDSNQSALAQLNSDIETATSPNPVGATEAQESTPARPAESRSEEASALEHPETDLAR